MPPPASPLLKPHFWRTVKPTGAVQSLNGANICALIGAQDPKSTGPSDAKPPVSEGDIRIVRRAREILNSVNVKVFGIVVNGVTRVTSGLYSTHAYDYTDTYVDYENEDKD